MSINADSQTLDKIVDLVRASTKPIDVDGVQYTPTNLYPVRTIDKPTTIEVHTLQGFADAVHTLGNEDGLVIIDSPTRVIYVSDEQEDLSRAVLVEATPMLPDQNIYGDEYDVAKMIIHLNTAFQPSGDVDKLIDYLSNIGKSDIVRIEDNGVSQSVTIQKGGESALKNKAELPRTVKLRPYRTFIELAQPQSTYLFRMSQKGNWEEGRAQARLHLADGGKWRIDAMESIQDQLGSILDNQYTILA